MRHREFQMVYVLAACALMISGAIVPASAQPSSSAQWMFSSVITTYPYQDAKKDQADDKKVQVSEGEQKAAKKIESAADATAKLKEAGEFVKKYPKSAIRSKVALHVAGKIAETQDPAQRITLVENYLSLFKESPEADLINPILRDAYIAANRPDDAFRMAAIWIEKNPDDVEALTQMALVGTEQAQRNNPKFVQQSQQYGTKAIELIEADKKPASLDDAQWNQYKTKWLPQLYQSMGVISLVGGNSADAKIKLEKAKSLNPSDPFTYALLGSIINGEYQQMAQQYQGMPSSPAQSEMLKKIHAQLDQVIDIYAHAVALSVGNPQYQALHDQVMQDLQQYYKFRHSGSTEGLQQLIDKYKKPSTPQ